MKIQHRTMIVALSILTLSAVLMSGCAGQSENEASDNTGKNAGTTSETSDTASENSGTASDSSTAGVSPAVGDDSRIVGKWESQKVKDTVYNFEADGSGDYMVMGNDILLEYSTNAGKITIQFKGGEFDGSEPLCLDYTITDNILNIVDSNGNDTLYQRLEN